MAIGDIDVVELNEAFAAQVLPVCEHTGIDIERQLNPHGGAIALGHPFGMTGARIMTTLINDLRTSDAQWGLETMCAAGGMAMATVVERLALTRAKRSVRARGRPVRSGAGRPRHVPRPVSGIGPGRFTGARLFGGQIASQALRAAASSVEVDHAVNSLHAYFLRPGRFGVPVDYLVDRIRDGSSFTTRRVVAMQDGVAILNLDASFHREEPGEEHQPPSPMGLVDPPEMAAPPDDPPWMRGRPVETRWAVAPEDGPRTMWVRVPARLPDDPTLHACLITFLSDMGPVGVVGGSIGAPGGSG